MLSRVALRKGCGDGSGDKGVERILPSCSNSSVRDNIGNADSMDGGIGVRMYMEVRMEQQVTRDSELVALPEVNLVKCYSVNQLAKESGLSNDFIEQACAEYAASNGKIGLPWFRRGSRKGVFVLSFAEYMHKLEKDVLLG